MHQLTPQWPNASAFPQRADSRDGGTATVPLISTPPDPAAAAKTEFDLVADLFSPAGRADPQVILHGSPLPGCQYPFVRDLLRDPASRRPPSRLPRPAFQLLRRWMIRPDGDRHRRVRDAFGGLFTARRVGRYQAVIAGRAAALIDQAAPAGTVDLVAGFARPLPYAVICDVLGVPPGDRDWLSEALAVLNRGAGARVGGVRGDQQEVAAGQADQLVGRVGSHLAEVADRIARQRAGDVEGKAVLAALGVPGGPDRCQYGHPRHRVGVSCRVRDSDQGAGAGVDQRDALSKVRLLAGGDDDG